MFEVPKGSLGDIALASFNWTNGACPYGGVTVDPSGNLYGTTYQGGANDDGTVFEIAHGSNTITSLAMFNMANGPEPYGGVARDAAGNLYGTTYAQDNTSYGTVFKVVPGSNTITTLATFNLNTGWTPYAGVTLDAKGNLFGTTYYGGAKNQGTVFEIPAGSNAITTLAYFNGRNGFGPMAGVTLDTAGNIYGTTFYGGDGGYGNVFELAQPPALTGAPVINGDDPNGLFHASGQPTPGVQRSMVEDIVYTFNEPVTIPDANAAFTVQLAGSMGTVPSTLFATALPGSKGTQWAVSLTGQADGVLASIANGEYSITINPTAVFAAADGVTAMQSGRTDMFYRLYGDIDGDRIVNNTDNFQFRKAQTTYNAAFDANADGFVTNSDNFQFKKDQAINFFSDGFVITI